MSSRGPYRRHSAQFKLQLCQEIRSGPWWPLQIPPPVATQTPPGRTVGLWVFCPCLS